jgi:hypothetical protein
VSENKNGYYRVVVAFDARAVRPAVLVVVLDCLVAVLPVVVVVVLVVVVVVVVLGA